jgi:hypothetical protein
LRRMGILPLCRSYKHQAFVKKVTIILVVTFSVQAMNGQADYVIEIIVYMTDLGIIKSLIT